MTDDKPYQTDNPKDIAEAKAKVKLRDNQVKEDVKALMQLPAFRRFVWWLLTASHIFHTSFTHSKDSETFYKEGERNVGLKVFLRIQEHDPEGYLVMAKENPNGE